MSGKKTFYECGTLKYTMPGLIVAIGLLMLGFFSFRFSSQMVSLVALRLKFLNASDTTVALIMSTIGSVFNMTVCPVVSFKSDRYRNRPFGLGRRNVFILGTLPMVCLGFLGFAFSGQLGNVLSGVLAPWAEFSPASLTVMIIGIVMVFYQFFYMFVASVIYYLYNDVIPARFLARAVGMVQVTGTAASTIFNLFLFKHGDVYFTEVLLLGAVVYFLGVGAMCLFLKEPVLPPLTDNEKRESRGIRGVWTFMKESFSHRYYWFFVWASTFWSAGIGGIGTFMVFFYMAMGMDLEAIGKLNGINGAVGMVIGMALATAGAFLIDRWHPVRTLIYANIMQFVFALFFAKWIFFTPSSDIIFIVILAGLIILTITTNIAGLAGMPMLIRTLPKSRFGQFCSANATVRSLVMMLLGLLLGVAIDVVRKLLGPGFDHYFVYRFIWVWRLIFSGLGIFFYFHTYKEYLRLGGELHYKAPAPWSPEKWETLDNTPSSGITCKMLRSGIFCWDALLVLYSGFTLWIAFYAEDIRFWGFVVPAMAVTLLVWFMLRRAICRRMPPAGERVYGGVLHHCALWIGAVQQVLLLGIGVVQTLMLFKKESLRVGGYIWIFEIIVLLATLLLLWVCNTIERTPAECNLPDESLS
ncbi:MAG: MFS transporter [Lentisphaeria bacterium]|nr:MFS transporter [Lentisphaeria bacterium]